MLGCSLRRTRPRVLSFCESFVGACDRWMRFDGPPGSVQASGLGGTRWILAVTAAWLMVLNPLLVRRGGEESQAISCASCKQTCETLKSPLSCKYLLQSRHLLLNVSYADKYHQMAHLIEMMWAYLLRKSFQNLAKIKASHILAEVLWNALCHPEGRGCFFFSNPLWWLGESPAVRGRMRPIVMAFCIAWMCRVVA